MKIFMKIFKTEKEARKYAEKHIEPKKKILAEQIKTDIVNLGDSDLYIYAINITKELDDFIHDQGIRHEVTIHYSDTLIICEIFLKSSKKYFLPKVKNFDNPKSEKLFAEIKMYIKNKFSYQHIQEPLKIYGENRVYLCKDPRLSNWTVLQAVIDSRGIIEDMILAGTLDIFECFDSK